MNKFTKKPVTIEARQFNDNDTPHQAQELVDWINNSGGVASHDGSKIYIETLEGVHISKLGDYIIKGVKGEFYPCKPAIFEMTYTPEETSHQQRVIKERWDLYDKITKLSEFIETSPAFKVLNRDEQNRLILQKSIMDSYLYILDQRIAAF